MQENIDKITIAKMVDKSKLAKKRNDVIISEFFNEYDITIIQKELQKNQIKNFIITGGYEEAQRKVMVYYPEYIDEEELQININSQLKAIKIELPNDIKGTIKHRNYLGMILSFGIAPERIGDIIVYDDSAYIIVMEENAEYLSNSIQYEKLFKKAKISIIDLKNVKSKTVEFEENVISINSLRLDNVISEIIKVSRKIAQELIEDEKVFINYGAEKKVTRSIKEQDILIIRGYGKFIVEEFVGKNKKDKELIRIKKYI